MLTSEYQTDRRSREKTALAHVLFIPDVDVPKGGYGISGGNGGNPERQMLHYDYHELDGIHLKAQPVTIVKWASVEGGGRTYSLAKGNLFVALVHRDGSVELTQLPRVLKDPGLSPNDVLARMKKMSPPDARVQKVEEARR